ncbi:guanylin-like [Paramormyrops kingsleyae]|uniref:Guanylate cyclase activator 2B n=1 Tax=Paramormyrops kingsleyae TaxID=1676925 RepID=A0A3B3SHG8_9TELE|nr:guanylin-like [Paramormyrops kingsleyae]
MRSAVVSVILTSCLIWSTMGIRVRDGELSFTLESVKLLKELTDGGDAASPRLLKSDPATACADPRLPVEFQSVCLDKSPGAVFTRLVNVLRDPDLCEICVNVACTGCL